MCCFGIFLPALQTVPWHSVYEVRFGQVAVQVAEAAVGQGHLVHLEHLKHFENREDLEDLEHLARWEAWRTSGAWCLVCESVQHRLAPGTRGRLVLVQ